jgi:hypothetical protein
MPGGRPSEKPDNLPELVDQYLNECVDDFKGQVKSVKLPTISGFALKIGFNESTMYEWEKRDEQFSKSLSKIKEEQKNRLLNQGLSGNYNSTIAKLVLSANHGISENQKIDLKTETTDLSDEQIEAKILELQRKAGAIGSAGGEAETQGKE